MAGPLLVPPLIGRTVPDLTATDQQYSATISGSSRPATVNIGVADPGRYVIVCAFGSSGTLPASITIGGISAPAFYSPSTSMVFYGAVVPTGTSAAIVCTLTSGNTYSVCYMVWRLVGAVSNVPALTDTAGNGSLVSSPLVYSPSLSTAAGSWLAVCGFAGGPAITMTASAGSPAGGTLVNGRSVCANILTGQDGVAGTAFSAIGTTSSGTLSGRFSTVGWD